MSEEQPKFLTALLSFFPVFLLLVIDLFAFWLQPPSNAMSHLAFGVLTAQLICLIAFIKGEICNGQRSRLGRVNLYFGLFWLVWLLRSVGMNEHNESMDLVCLCGLAIAIITWKQPVEIRRRHLLLKIAGFIGMLGVIGYGLMLVGEVNLIQVNPVAQILLGIILANLAFVISRNRLKGFIALLMLAAIAFLALNALFVLANLFILSQQSAVVFTNEFALLLYLLLHLVMAAILAVHVFKKWALSYNSLLILLLMTASLPLWANFAYLM
ncbi:hypothetical protein [Aggregatibacter segnis]|uniref:hypothetical protein n=1 Tax=Aggregatibacter segnis TaxID=739 RepID=UPI0028EEB62B|nr:hypothetical protein [Aggregatibacter segnis]